MGYYVNPDCQELVEAEAWEKSLQLALTPNCRPRSELVKAALATPTGQFLFMTEEEYKTIKREVGLGYRWQGARIVSY